MVGFCFDKTAESATVVPAREVNTTLTKHAPSVHNPDRILAGTGCYYILSILKEASAMFCFRKATLNAGSNLQREDSSSQVGTHHIRFQEYFAIVTSQSFCCLALQASN